MELMVIDAETINGSLEDVRAFCTVFELGSISAAARQLHTTKGGLSRRVSRLEERLGVKLLARTSRAVSPTEEGAAFYAKASDALALLDEAVDGARQSQSAPKGHLRVTAPPDFGVDVLPPLIVEFQANHPQITIDLLVSTTLLDLAALRIDLALRAAKYDLPDMNYRASTVIEFVIALYAAPSYLAQRETPIQPAGLADHAFIAVGDSAGAELLTLTDQRGTTESLALHPVIRTSDFACACRLTEAAGGICCLPDIIAAAGIKAGRLVRVLPEWLLARAKLHAITLAGHEAPARVRAFKEFVRSRLAAACPQ